jgi:hypothetical protein
VIDIVLPELPERALDLAPEEVITRDIPGDTTDTDEKAPLTGRVLFGGPRATAITEDYVSGDPQLAAFVAGEAQHTTYHLVHAALTLRSAPEDPPFESASVEIRLTATGPKASTVWSIRPLRVTRSAEVTTEWRLGPKLELFDVGLEVGSVGGTRTETQEEVYLEGYGELSSEPAWLLHRTSTRPLRGSHRLIMVVQAPRGATTEVRATVRTRVRARQLLWYRSADLDPLVISTTL